MSEDFIVSFVTWLEMQEFLWELIHKEKQIETKLKMHKKENHFLLLIPVNIGLNVIAIKHGAD